MNKCPYPASFVLSSSDDCVNSLTIRESQVSADGFTVVCPDGRIKVLRVKPADGPKVGAGEWAKAANLAVGARFV